MEIYYRTGRSNSGDCQNYSTKREAMREAKKIANRYQEPVFVDKQTDDEPIDYYEVKPDERLQGM